MSEIRGGREERGRASARRGRNSEAVGALMTALDVLPWPWGEDLLARMFMVVGAVRGSRRRPALGWAAAHAARRPWRLAAALWAFRGRWVARSGLLGLRDPAELRPHLRVHGAEHLSAASGAAILLGFHLGPPNADLALRILGHRLTWLGGGQRGPEFSPAWRRPGWRPFLESSQHLSRDGRKGMWPALVYRARRTLLDGGRVFTMGDGGGREAFRVPLPGGPMIVRAGWRALHELTGAPVVPVLTHLEGRTQVITVAPALPSSTSESGREAQRELLASVLEDYVERFPDQCVGLAFSPRRRTRSLPAAPVTGAPLLPTR